MENAGMILKQTIMFKPMVTEMRLKNMLLKKKHLNARVWMYALDSVNVINVSEMSYNFSNISYFGHYQMCYCIESLNMCDLNFLYDLGLLFKGFCHTNSARMSYDSTRHTVDITQ